MKFPLWIPVTVALVVAGGLVYGGWWFGTRVDDAELTALQDSVAVHVAVQARRDTVDAERLDSIAALQDSLAVVRVKRDTVTIRIRSADNHTEATGETLAEHLTRREDGAGLQLWEAHAAADRQSLAFRDQAILFADAEILNLETQNRMQGNRIASRDSTIAELNADLTNALTQAERWHAKANPPLHVKILRDGWKVAAAFGAGLLVGNL
jgi:hypothetical protein